MYTTKNPERKEDKSIIFSDPCRFPSTSFSKQIMLRPELLLWLYEAHTALTLLIHPGSLRVCLYPLSLFPTNVSWLCHQFIMSKNL